MKKLICFLLLIVCFKFVAAQQTYNISGVVTDDKDRPIPGATVFLGDSRNATATDINGDFDLRKVRQGKYSLVVKMIGYTISTHDFMLQNKDAKFRIKLKEDNQLLNMVNISAMSKTEREYYLSVFMRCFFGTSYQARYCKIKNPEIINYYYERETGLLTAYTDDFLIIENEALGYRIKYLLNSFSYDSEGTDGIVSFKGKLFYEDMQGDDMHQKKWREARAEAYLGSITHFFRALFDDKLSENKFVVYQVPNEQLLRALRKKKKEVAQKYSKPVKSLSSFISNVDENFKAINLNLLMRDSTELNVLYTPEREPADFSGRGVVIERKFKMPLGQLSLLRPVGDSVLLSANGEVSPASNLIKGGFWTWGQMADFVPSDYELPQDLETPKMKRLGKRDEAIVKTTD